MAIPKQLLQTAFVAISALVGASLPGLLNAETIQVPVGQQAQEKWTMQRPVNGMKQAKVEEFFGKPVDWREAVGDPPISTWIYPEFVVYFEYDEVVHTVLRQDPRPVASTSDGTDRDSGE